jgi:hypothetical protein
MATPSFFNGLLTSLRKLPALRSAYTHAHLTAVKTLRLVIPAASIF